MHKANTECNDLIERTAAVLDNKRLQQLFVSTQRNNLELCIEYALVQWADICGLKRWFLAQYMTN